MTGVWSIESPVTTSAVCHVFAVSDFRYGEYLQLVTMLVRNGLISHNVYFQCIRVFVAIFVPQTRR